MSGKAQKKQKSVITPPNNSNICRINDEKLTKLIFSIMRRLILCQLQDLYLRLKNDHQIEFSVQNIIISSYTLGRIHWHKQLFFLPNTAFSVQTQFYRRLRSFNDTLPKLDLTIYSTQTLTAIIDALIEAGWDEYVERLQNHIKDQKIDNHSS